MNARNVIEATKGRFFSLTFIRSTDTKNGKAGEEVTRVFRVGVRKGVTGDGLKFDPRSKGLITLWCKQGFRMVREDHIKSIRYAGGQITFTQ